MPDANLPGFLLRTAAESGRPVGKVLLTVGMPYQPAHHTC